MNHASDETLQLVEPPSESGDSHSAEENSGLILDMRVTTKRDEGEEDGNERPQVEIGRQEVENGRPAVVNGCPVGASRGRRKQRKPVRLPLDETLMDLDLQEKFFNEICENNDPLVRGGAGEDGKQSSWKIPVEEGQAEDGRKELTANAIEGIGGAGAGSSEEQFVCHECGHTETTRAELGRHLLETHVVSAVEKPSDKYPTKYHRLGSEFREASFQFGRISEKQLTRISEKQLTSANKEQEQGPEDSRKSAFPAEVSMSSTKVPERETELSSSSKHGVKIHHQHHHHHHQQQQQQQHHNSGSSRYGGSAGGTSSSTTSRSPVHLDLSPLDLIAPSRIHPPDSLQQPQQQQQRDNHPLAQPPLPIPLSQLPKPVSMMAAASISSALSFATAGINICSTSGVLCSSSSTFSSVRNSVNSSSSCSSGDTEDYCNRCQKHFCNKYYLRKHKQDVHGVGPGSGIATSSQQTIDSLILPPPPLPLPPQSSSDVGLSTNSLGTDATSSVQTSICQRLATTLANHSMLPFSPIITSLPFVLPFPSGPVTNSIILQQPPITSSPSFLGTTVIPGFPSLPSLMFLNPFASPLTILKTAPPFLQAASDNSNFASSSLNTLAELQNIENSVSDTHASAKNSILPTTGFSGGGDQTAHCELCRKEFCNTYFLKVHKREKHGIPLDEGDASLLSKRQQATLGLLDGVRFSGSTEAEPGENLIVKNPTLSLKLPDDPFASQSDRNEDTLCRLCKKQLSNRYSLMMHLLTTHSIKPEGFGLASELLQLDTMNRAMAAAAAAAAAASTTSSDSSKLSDRVACDICNKEVCNKYFLKTHKIKVHGLDSSLGIDGFRDGLTVSANETLLQDIRPLLHLDHLSQKHEDIAKTFMNIAAEIGLKNAVNELKREQKIQLDKDQLNLLSVDKSSLKISSRKDTSKEDLSTAISLIAKNSYNMAQLDPGCRENKGKGTGQGNHPGSSAAADLFKHCSAGKHSGHEKSKRSWSGGKHSSKEGKAISNKPSEEVLKKSGIDPEAYCEICKKEFCSKYFLKTHKHKTHGVKSEPGMEVKPAPSAPLQVFSGAAVASAAIAQSVATASAVLDVAGDRRSSEMAENNAGQKTTREVSSNGARVTCEVCSKALCNKYFLKTHMLKIHGSSVDAAGCTIAPAAAAAAGGGTTGGGGGRAKPDSISAKDSVSSTDVATSAESTASSEEPPPRRPSSPSHSPPPSLPVNDSIAKDNPDPTEPRLKEAGDSRDQTETESWLRPTTDEAAQVMPNTSVEDAVPCSVVAATREPVEGELDSAATTETTDGRCARDSEDDEVREKMDWIREADLPRLDASEGIPSHPDDLQPPKLVREEGVFDPSHSPPKIETLSRQDQSCGATAAGSQHSSVQVDCSASENHGNGTFFGEGSIHGPTVQSVDIAGANESATPDRSRASTENGAATPHRRRAHRKRCHAPPGDKSKNETSCKKIKHDEDQDNEAKEAKGEEDGGQGLRGSKDSGGQRSAEEEDVAPVMDVDRELETSPQHLKDSPSTTIVASDECVPHQLAASSVVGSASVEPGSATTPPTSCSSSSSCSSPSSSSFTSCNVYLPSSVQQPLATSLACTATTSID